LKADNEQGYTVKSKKQYDYDQNDSKYTLELDRAKSRDDVDGWLSVAEQKYKALQDLRDSYDPEIEQDKINDTQKKMEDLMDQASKYQEYGGFTKGKGTWLRKYPQAKGTKGKGSKTGKKGFQVPNGGIKLVGETDTRELIKNVGVTSKRLRRKF